MSSLNGLNGRYTRLENVVSPAVDSLDDLRILFTYVSDDELAEMRSGQAPQNSPRALEILENARQRYKDGLPPFGPGQRNIQ